MSEIFDRMTRYMPLSAIIVLWLLAFVPRAIIVLALPPDARYEWHKLHKIFNFFAFY